MAGTCDFVVALRVIAADGVTVVFDFNNRAGGFTVETVQIPEESVRKIRTTAPRVAGDFTLIEADDAGDLNAAVRVEGSSWAQCTSRWESARTAYRAESSYFVELEVEGVVTRWRTERPDAVVPGPLEPVSLLLKRQSYSLRWHVQPNPSVTIL